MSIFRFVCAVGVVALSVGQAPADTGNQPQIGEWCSVPTDCLSNPPDPFPTGVDCNLGFCTCTDGYVLHRATSCKEVNNPNPPLVRVVVELTWDNVACDNLPSGFEATIETDIRRIYGIAITVVLNIKCGSVVVLVVMDEVDADVAADTNIATAMETSDTVQVIGPVSTVDTYAGSGSCQVLEGQKEVLSIGGICQPISCQTGYALVAGTSVADTDSCVLIPDESDDDLDGGAVAAIVVGALGATIIIILIVYSLKKAAVASSEEQQKEQSDLSENGPDNLNDENNGPDAEGI